MSVSKTSLQRKLVRHMIVVQMLTLALFFGLGVFPVVVYPAIGHLGGTQTIDPSAARVFAQALKGVQRDRIDYEHTPALQDLLAQYPDIFFYAKNQSGASVVLGDIPAYTGRIIPNMDILDTLEVRTRNAGEGSFLLRYENSRIGPVHILTGNGPLLGVASLLRNISLVLAIGIVLVVIFANAVAIPWLVRRELRGIQNVANDAARISIDARGARLRNDGVPDEIAPLVKAVNAALSRLDESFVARQRFLADASHEIRTPIAILLARLEEADPFPQRQRLILDVNRLSGLTEQLLDLQRMDHAVDFAAVDLVLIAEAVVGDMAPLAIAGGYEISLNAEIETVSVTGDARSIYRAVANLVQNAIAHGGGQGEITVSVTPDRTLSVADEGKGVPDGERDRIFEPFHRLHRSGRGVGLGLNLVQAVMEKHQGSASVADNAAGGASFKLAFPAIV